MPLSTLTFLSGSPVEMLLIVTTGTTAQAVSPPRSLAFSFGRSWLTQRRLWPVLVKGSVAGRVLWLLQPGCLPPTSPAPLGSSLCSMPPFPNYETRTVTAISNLSEHCEHK